MHSSRKLHPITARAVILSFYAIYHWWSIHQKKSWKGARKFCRERPQIIFGLLKTSLNYSFLEIGVRNSASHFIIKAVFLKYHWIYFQNLQMLRYFSDCLVLIRISKSLKEIMMLHSALASLRKTCTWFTQLYCSYVVKRFCSKLSARHAC